MKFSPELEYKLNLVSDIPIEFTQADLSPALTQQTIEDAVKYWDDLPIDQFAESSPHVRRRRHATFIYDSSSGIITRQNQTPYYQDISKNKIYGGVERKFAPIENWYLEKYSYVTDILKQCAHSFSNTAQRYLIHCHFMRIPIDHSGVGRPSPEGIHQDGFEFISLHLIRKVNCRGGQTVVTDGKGGIVSASYLNEFLDSIVINDEKFYHAALPIYSIDQSDAHRDTMLASYQLIE